MIATIRDFLRLAALINFARLFNYLQIKSSYLFSVIFKRFYHRGFPSFVSVEPTNLCNLQCPECFTSSDKFTRAKGFLDEHTFVKVLSSTKKHAFYLNLYFQGEPFLNEQLVNYISLAKKARFYVAVSTNGHFLSAEICEKLVHSGLDRLIISLDGMDAETYKTYRVGGDFDKVINGIKTLSGIKEKLKKTHPFIELQFLITRKNQKQVLLFKDFGKEIGTDRTTIKTLQLIHLNKETAEEWLPDAKSRYSIPEDGLIKIKSGLPNRCFRMWSSLVITWDGEIIPCCFDKNADYTMGNIMNEDLKTVWNNKNYNGFRKRVFSERKKIDICKNCSEGLKKQSL